MVFNYTLINLTFPNKLSCFKPGMGLVGEKIGRFRNRSFWNLPLQSVFNMLRLLNKVTNNAMKILVEKSRVHNEEPQGSEKTV